MLPAEPALPDPDAEPDEIHTPPDAEPDALARRTSPLLLGPSPLSNASDAPLPNVLTPPDTVTSPPVAPAPPAKANEPPTSSELRPPDTRTDPLAPAASPPDTLTDPLDCVDDAPDPIDTAPDEPVSTDPLVNDTAPLLTEAAPLPDPSVTAPLTVEALSPLRIVTLPPADESDAPPNTDTLEPSPVADEPPVTSMDPALASPDPLPMRTDPLDTLLALLRTSTLPLEPPDTTLVETQHRTAHTRRRRTAIDRHVAARALSVRRSDDPHLLRCGRAVHAAATQLHIAANNTAVALDEAQAAARTATDEHTAAASGAAGGTARHSHVPADAA
ncbi:hypothetical protein PHYSODRAFT_500510 [Phytophthora sojae]|uniref:Uncharacterized protein n=1 Tax=Phytophthora sojae (strain P6497) TaxID=1094619 RepID=G4ZCG6_PHYSP|nr:hypothetical protein PHYSODRAFT_500510 [Phytophthora sojae]EGZ16855.1 hypothetical protein PHYSODRAFT_500510 [Phytophthora sojae]|eukprot:XP_009525913.1 hypothetical protein PHYSODRAFT_500510 [Phytophthora sojae]